MPLILTVLAILYVVVVVLPSIRVIGPTEVGLVMRRYGKKLPGDDPIAFHGEAGYQADLLMPGLRFRLWITYHVEKFPWVQVPAGEIGVVIAQVGDAVPQGAKSAVYRKEFGNFTDLRAFVDGGGQKGVQRRVLAPGSLLPLHPVAFLAITKERVYGRPASPEMKRRAVHGILSPEAFNLEPEQLEVVRIQPRIAEGVGEKQDVVGVVTTLEGKPLSSGYIASRLGGFGDVEALEAADPADDARLIDALLGDRNHLHDNYQDIQAFLDAGGEMGLQHDVLRYGAYNLNPFLVKVEIVPMLVVRQGEAAAVKAYVGLSTQDTSGAEFKFGSLVRPGHRGLWREPLRTGKFAINPRIYQAEIVPTAILNLNWAKAISEAHNLDRKLESIIAKSKEGFVFGIDLQVLIHVPDAKAPRVISMVGTMQNLVNEVLQAAVGNLFRDKLGSMPAIEFIETRQRVQQEAFEHIRAQLSGYEVEVRGVYIQDVTLPQDVVKVLTEREIANQEIATFRMQQSAQIERVSMEKAKGTADMQAELARSAVGVDIKSNDAKAREKEGEGEAAYIEQTGRAAGAEVRAVGLARAESYERQAAALGQSATALVNAVEALSRSGVSFVPQVLVNGSGGALDGLAATLMSHLRNRAPDAAAANTADA
jgi:regulator of protease activity HflC (stomatin/prohibitin superfamily)